ncbi:MAG TPA: hypothetical protein VFV87_21265 [Pirellulaceae bacterium]|nr:hypothetical protein [Pirellulaceae bacterium]
MRSMRYRLHTLLIVLAVGPPVLAAIGIAVFSLRPTSPAVFGQVTFRGRPAQLVQMTFLRAAGDGAYSTVTDLEGNYRLKDDSSGRPIRPGAHFVLFYANRSARSALANYPASLPGEYGNAKNPQVTAAFLPGACRVDFDLK